MKTLAKTMEVLEMISTDMENDAKEFEGRIPWVPIWGRCCIYLSKL